jgi:hypothetical protein
MVPIVALASLLPNMRNAGGGMISLERYVRLIKCETSHGIENTDLLAML